MKQLSYLDSIKIYDDGVKYNILTDEIKNNIHCCCGDIFVVHSSDIYHVCIMCIIIKIYLGGKCFDINEKLWFVFNIVIYEF